MTVKIHNKEYQTVAERLVKMRELIPDAQVVTELISADGDIVVMKASLMTGGEVISTGYAEEIRGSSNINKTSALENCETSAVGRALALTGHSELLGTSIASADEVAQAISQQDLTEALMKGIKHGEAFVRFSDTIQVIKDGISENRLDLAAQGWHELTNEEKALLWVAPTKGGPFTTEERKVMQSSEFREAHPNET